MTNVISRLQEDHGNFVRLLDMIEAQLIALQRIDAPAVEISVMASALEYICDYPNRYHHPIENAMFAVVMKKTHQYDNLLKIIGMEHRIIDQQTAELCTLIAQLENGDTHCLDQLIELTEKYLELQRRHLIDEEDVAFPIAMKLLDENDWAEIEQAVEYTDDPLFENDTDGKFESIYQKLIHPSDAHGRYSRGQDTLWDRQIPDY